MVQHIWWSFVLHFVLSLFSYQKKGVPCLQRADNQTTRRCHNPVELFTTSLFVFRRRISFDCRRLWLKNIVSKHFSTRSKFGWFEVQFIVGKSILCKASTGNDFVVLSNFEDYFHCEDPPLSRRASFKRERTPHSLSRLRLGVLAAAQNTKVRSFSFNLFLLWNTNPQTQKAWNNRLDNVKLSLLHVLSGCLFEEEETEFFCFNVRAALTCFAFSLMLTSHHECHIVKAKN